MSCLAITFTGPKTKNGRRLFENFVQANKYSFWNRELVEAVESLIFMGFMRPCTVFVSGSVTHLQSLRTAWSRRVLKPAEGYAISSLGEMGAIQTVEQMHFVPLADVLCDAIVTLTRLGHGTTLAAVRQYVIRNCPYVAPPTVEMVKQTVANLTATGLVYKMGDHLFVSVPAQTTEKTKVTVECQTGISIIVPAEPEKKERLGFLARIFNKKQSSAAPQVPALSTKTTPEWDKKLLTRVTCRHSNHRERRLSEHESRRHPRCERIQITSSSECLNYGPIDPPECLPRKVEVIEDLRIRPRRRAKRKEIRTSTPVEGSDSAYSPSPVTDSNEEPGSCSEPEGVKANCMEIPHQELPDSYEWFAEQVAGHHPSVIKNGRREIVVPEEMSNYSISLSTLGLLKKRGSDKILKPKLEALRGECEIRVHIVNVYKMLARTLRHSTSAELNDSGGDDVESNSNGWPDVQIKDVEGLAALTPRFYGVTSLVIDREDHDFLILEDVTAVYRRPAILDVKMGRITFDPLANAAKQEKETIKYPPQRTLGFRLLGYRIHSNDGKVVVKDKEWGKAHNENNILDGLLEFFSGRGADVCLISDALLKLDRVRKWFSTQKSFHFYASSLLFVYENDLSRPSDIQLVMIDFSHVFPANNELDFNYIHGLDVFYDKMEAIRDEFISKSQLTNSVT